MDFDVAGVEVAVEFNLGGFEVGAFGVVPPAGGAHGEVVSFFGLELFGVEELVVP